MELETLPFPENMRRELSQKVITSLLTYSSQWKFFQIRKYKADYDGVKKKFKICEENYLEQKAKEKLMGARLEVILSYITISHWKPRKKKILSSMFTEAV